MEYRQWRRLRVAVNAWLTTMLVTTLSLVAAELWGATAVIDGPVEARPGDLVVLSGAESDGEGYRWIAPAGLQTLQCDPLHLAFASGTPGRYTFTLIAASNVDIEGETPRIEIDVATHTVVVGKPTPVPEPEPDPFPDDPDPEPAPGDFAELVASSEQLARGVNDPATAAGLAAAIRAAEQGIGKACDAGQCSGLDAAKAQIVAAIEARLLARQGQSRNANWLDGWRRPANAMLTEYSIRDVPTYRAAMRALATGLEQAAGG